VPLLFIAHFKAQLIPTNVMNRNEISEAAQVFDSHRVITDNGGM